MTAKKGRPTPKQNKWNNPIYKESKIDSLKLKVKRGMKFKEKIALIRLGAFDKSARKKKE